MSYDAMRAPIRARLASWPGGVAIVGDAFGLAKGEPSEGTPYVRPRIEDGKANWTSVGGRKRYRAEGTLVNEVVVPSETGDSGATSGPGLAASLLSHFQGFESSGVHFSPKGWARDVGSEDGRSQRFLVFHPFYYEEVL